MPLWVDIVVKLTPAFVTLMLGLGGSMIAYLQYRNTKDRLRLDLFSKRLEAFEKLQEFFTCLLRDGCVNERALPILAEARYKSRFLFGTGIDDYFEELWTKAADMRQLNIRLYGPNSLPVGPERARVCEEESTLMKWNLGQMKTSHKRYAPYLKFNK